MSYVVYRHIQYLVTATMTNGNNGLVNIRMRRGGNWRDPVWHFFDADLDADATDLFGPGLSSVLGLEVTGRDL